MTGDVKPADYSYSYTYIQVIDDSSIRAILGGIVDISNPPPLMSTLLWDANVDLDLYFSCSDGSEIGYGVTNTCGGAVD